MAQKKMDRKVTVITGGATGIGGAAARLFASEGARVVIADVDETRGQQIIEELKVSGAEAIFVKTDVSKAEDIKNLFAQAKKTYGCINSLICNAGINGPLAPVPSHPLEAWNKVLDIDLHGAFLFCKYGIPYLVEQGGGTLVITASLSALESAGYAPAYNVAKAGVYSLMKSLAYDYGKYNVRVNALCPAAVQTNLLKGVLKDMKMTPEEEQEYSVSRLKGYPLGRLGEPQDIAKLMLFLASDDSSFITGEGVIIDGGYWSGMAI